MSYPRNNETNGVPASPIFPKLEQEVLAFWATDGTFQASIDRRVDAPEWVFYDGPPFANGLPHYGHLLTGYAKDVFPRYQTMRGKRVHRRFGWDTHGLPAELEAMRQLGITTKADIEQMGVGAFNQAARVSVLHYTKEWQDYVTRQARWVDFENDYKTLDTSFMESVIWAFSELHRKGLAYEGFRVLPYCWKDETPLSGHELRMDDDVYQLRQDPSVTVAFPLFGTKAEKLGLTGVSMLAWTTTPWTLPTNAALAVGPEIEYAQVLSPGGGRYLLASDTLKNYAKELGEYQLVGTFRGADLGGLDYQPLWNYYRKAYGQNAFSVLVADYVATGEGTGIVHQAPAYGEDDQLTCAAANIPVVLSLDERGRFLPEVDLVAGVRWDEANQTLIRSLRDQGRLFRTSSYQHSYPHCWRCREPLIYKAVSSWFVRVSAIRDRLLELNQEISWVPENVKDGQFGMWLQNARDWSISRNRYFGSPIPVWKSDDPRYPRVDVYGSLADLEKDFGRLPRDENGEVNLHRPYIDELTRANPDDPSGTSTMRRIEDVLDVWFDSGSMPFAQVHYPFENQEWFQKNNPADFIVEYIGQTRGWFYLMHVLATALFDRPAYRNVLSHGIVLGSDGQKMSKSLRNYPDVSEVFDRDGADAMRWFLLSSSVIRGGNLVVTEEGIRQGMREVMLPLWSSYYFFTLYANSEPYQASWRSDSTEVLDQYILAKTGQLIRAVAGHLDSFDTPLACVALRDFLDVLTNWYVRRSRDRFWSGDDKRAFDTLFTVLETLTRVAAPLLPLLSENIWRGLTAGRSVHLSDWPTAEDFPEDAKLVATMDQVRELAATGLALRKANKLRVRLPLARLTVAVANPDALESFAHILAEELNVKKVQLVKLGTVSFDDFGVSRRIVPNARALGPRLGKDVQTVIREAKAGNWEFAGERLVVAGFVLETGEYELKFDASDPELALAFLADGTSFVVLDTKVTADLATEGLARDVVRVIQQARRSADFAVSDRIRLWLGGDADVLAAIDKHQELIAKETLALELETQISTGDTPVGESSLVSVRVERL